MNKCILVLVFLILLASYSKLETCTCIGERTLEEMKYDSYDVVFEGKLIKKALLQIEGKQIIQDTIERRITNRFYYKYTFEVNVIYTPPMFNNFFITVYSEQGSGTCGIELDLNTDYIIMAGYDEIEPDHEYSDYEIIKVDEKKLVLVTNRCTHTRISTIPDLKKLDSIYYYKVLLKREVIINR